MKFSLEVCQGSHKGRRIPISIAQFMIGRDSRCHLRPASQTISKRHCELLLRDGKVFLHDLNSTNGTFVNDDRVEGERELNDGDVLKIGPLDFVIHLENADAMASTQVEKETQVPEAPAEEPVEAPVEVADSSAETVEQPAVAEANGEAVDEDTVGSMLLELGSDSPEEDLSGSTVMDVLKPASEEAPKAGPYRPQNNKPAASSANTSQAAKAILEKFRRRPRG